MPSREARPWDLESTQCDIEGIEGWLRPAQAQCLWHLAASVPEAATIVEIGSYQGRSTIVLARAAPRDARVFAIDPHAGNDRGPGQWQGLESAGQRDNVRFTENLQRAGVATRIVHLREFSQRAHALVDGDIDLLYVDGAHGYRPARADIVDWGGRVNQGGVMVVHDVYTSLFVTLAVITSLWWSSSWEYAGRTRSMAVFRRRALANRERLPNLLRQAINVPWFAKNLVVRGLRRIGATRLAQLGEASGGGVY